MSIIRRAPTAHALRRAIVMLALCGTLPGTLPMAHAASSTGASSTPMEATPRPVMLRYLNAPPEGRPLLRTPKLGIAIGGRWRRAVMDTGSTGIVISASAIPDLESLPDLGPGTLTYSSSGRVMIGRYVRAAVTLTGADGASVTTRPLPVLAVTRIDCLKTARRCQPNPAPHRVAMLGVGFARENDHQSGGTPRKNPFLNLPGMALSGEPPGTLGRGYIVTRTGVQVGLGAGDGADFARVPLAPSPTPGDWQATPACFALAGRTPPACGTLLVDTGVFRSFLTVPETQFSGLLTPDGRPVLADGVRLDVTPGPGVTAPRYGYVVGDRADPVAPTEVIVVARPGQPAFLNTSVRVLNAYDYLYDADKGAVGFRRLSP
ncbi:hypothetical protein [Xanthobacter agilis]|uniref:hypothetical protein n=1 Tax=Xanthobacter agilis TaxID=47492 RepID=UPI003727133E